MVLNFSFGTPEARRFQVGTILSFWERLGTLGNSGFLLAFFLFGNAEL